MPVSDVRGYSYDSVQHNTVEPFSADTDGDNLRPACTDDTRLGQRDAWLLAAYTRGNYLNIAVINEKYIL